MLERRRKSGKERGGGEVKAAFWAAAVGGAAVGVSLKSGCGSGLEVRHNHIQTRVALNEDCVSTGEAAAKRSPDEVAELFGITRNHVDQIKSRLKARLRVLAEGLLHA